MVTRIPNRLQILSRRLKKWFLFAFLIGLAVGLLVAALDSAVTRIAELSNPLLANRFGVVLLPIAGLALAGAALSALRDGGTHGTEEVIKTYHEPEGRLNGLSAMVKAFASIVTIGLGGSAGLEGPSIHLGATVGDFAHRTLSRFNLDPAEAKSMMIAGGAAGIAAIFKAPLTGVVFGLEVPYKDDMAKESLIPSLVASVTSYLVFVSLMGIRPLFKTERVFAIESRDLLYAAALGLLIGLAARLFVKAFRAVEAFFERLRLRQPIKTAIGGGIVGLAGLAAFILFGSPMPLGLGYAVVGRVISETLSLKVLAGLLALKMIATIATLASGGVGGIFIPMIMMGSILGAIIGIFAPSERSHLYPIIGMPSFLAAGYKTPLAAVTFIAETTGSPGYIIPGLIAATVGYMVSGRVSVSKNQRWTRSTKIEIMLSAKVAQAMTADVISVPEDISVRQFFEDFLLRFRHKSLPVVDKGKKLVGMIGVSDINEIPAEEWPKITVGAAARAEVLVAYKDQSLVEVLNAMNAADIDRMPVVDRGDEKKMVGIISSTDIVSLEELAKFAEERAGS